MIRAFAATVFCCIATFPDATAQSLPQDAIAYIGLERMATGEYARAVEDDSAAIRRRPDLRDAYLGIENGQLITPPGVENGPETKKHIEWLGTDRFVAEAMEFSPVGTMAEPKNPILG